MSKYVCDGCEERCEKDKPPKYLFRASGPVGAWHTKQTRLDYEVFHRMDDDPRIQIAVISETGRLTMGTYSNAEPAEHRWKGIGHGTWSETREFYNPVDWKHSLIYRSDEPFIKSSTEAPAESATDWSNERYAWTDGKYFRIIDADQANKRLTLEHGGIVPFDLCCKVRVLPFTSIQLIRLLGTPVALDSERTSFGVPTYSRQNSGGEVELLINGCYYNPMRLADLCHGEFQHYVHGGWEK